MPRCCSVSGCKSNYRSEKETVTTFALPKDEVLKSKWLRKIPTDFGGLKNPIVCIKHFHDSEIIKIDKCIVAGETKEFQRKIPKLKEGSVPSIFPNLPKYLSSTPSTSKRLPDVEESNMDTAIRQSFLDFEDYVKKRTVNNIDDIVVHFNKNKQSLDNEWTLLRNEHKVILCYVDITSDLPCILGSIVIKNCLEFDIYINSLKIPSQKLPKEISVLNSINAFDDLLNLVKSKINDHDAKSTLCSVADLLKKSISADDMMDTQVAFMCEQLQLSESTENNRRYSGNTLILASTLYARSPSAYNYLYHSNLLYLPHPRNLNKLISKFSLTENTMQGSIEYLKTKMQLLKDHELIVNLLLDEIYIQPELNFKGGTVFGCSESDPSKLAKTVQVFMISGIVSKYKDVVSIVPVYNLTAEQLKGMIFDILVQVEKIGFKVISMISDNNAINKKAFELFTSNKVLQSVIPHPLDNSRQLFFLFDSVHIIKCIRNNWITKKSENCSIKFLDMDSSKLLTAQYKHLEVLYELEKNSLVKYGHLLSNKVLYPSSIQKQNVKLALRIFDDKNIAALKCVASKNPTLFPGFEETCIFINIFSTWWKIVNVQSAFEGKRFNDEYREPIRENTSPQIEFLRKMTLWLKNWRLSVPISYTLTPQTFQALINTNEALLKLIPYMLNTYKLDYLLLGKFQNDNLEGRFGCYRQLSGANYYISYMQLLESERKLLFNSIVVLACKNHEIPLKTLLPCQETYTNTANIEPFYEVLQQEFMFDEIPETILPILIYIAGFAVRKELRFKKCNICSNWLQLDKEVDVQLPCELITELDRGKLILPTECATIAVAGAWFTLQKIIDSFHDIFLSTQHQLSILCRMSNIQLIQYFDMTMYDISEKCTCQETLQSKLEKINLRTCKIMLNNFVKKENDMKTKPKSSQQKIKKLKPN